MRKDDIIMFGFLALVVTFLSLAFLYGQGALQ